MRNRSEYQNDKKSNKTALIRSAILSAAMILLISVVSYAWFVNQSNIATLVEVGEPSPISILGPNGTTMSQLNLSYTDKDEDADGQVTIKRVICVKTDSDEYQLEIAHTTNMKNLSFTLYPATEKSVSATGSEDEVTDQGYSYVYDASEKISGKYVNPESPENGDYKYADKTTYHEQNYKGYSDVQAHAEPLYWRADGALKASEKKDNEGYSLTYYVLEISWKETSKETDLFYILAQKS